MYRATAPGLFIFLGLFILLTISMSLFAQGRVGAGVYAYPSAGQSTEQMATDQFDCHNWSVQQTGFDPTRDHSPEPIAYTPPPTKSGGSADRSDGQNAARGGARGAVMGAVVTGNPVTGVVIGSASSVLFGKKKRKDKEKEEESWQQQHQQQQQLQQQETQEYVKQGTESYRGAYLACMGSKKYSVK
jgi:hypothetical protein